MENIENVEAVKALTWFEMTLKKKQIPEEKIRYYVPGKDCWMEADSWENIRRQEQIFYLDACHRSIHRTPVDLQISSCSYTLTLLIQCPQTAGTVHWQAGRKPEAFCRKNRTGGKM